MTTFTKLESGSWRVQVGRKRRYVSETFLRREDACVWATEIKCVTDQGKTPQGSRTARLKNEKEREREHSGAIPAHETHQVTDIV